MPHLLRDIVESQIAQVDLLLAMYPEANEVNLDDSTKRTMETLKAWCLEEGPQPQGVPHDLTLTVNLYDNTTANQRRCLQAILEVPLCVSETETSDALPPKMRIRQPEWMTKAEVAKLSAEMPKEDVFSALEFLQGEIQKCRTMKVGMNSEPNNNNPSSHGNTQQQRIVRVWFYFPSLSTREKREDLVNHAPVFGLTGFVLAGKPGVLCLEGSSTDIDAYMKFIKTESWGDIPSHHKKVSERYREDNEVGIKRVFTDMHEITDMLGEKRGERANRGDMKALELWLTDKGLGDAFSQVLL